MKIPNSTPSLDRKTSVKWSESMSDAPPFGPPQKKKKERSKNNSIEKEKGRGGTKKSMPRNRIQVDNYVNQKWSTLLKQYASIDTLTDSGTIQRKCPVNYVQSHFLDRWQRNTV